MSLPALHLRTPTRDQGIHSEREPAPHCQAGVEPRTPDPSLTRMALPQSNSDASPYAADFALGYYKFGSHALLPVEECPISSPLINRAIRAIWELRPAG